MLKLARCSTALGLVLLTAAPGACPGDALALGGAGSDTAPAARGASDDSAPAELRNSVVVAFLPETVAAGRSGAQRPGSSAGALQAALTRVKGLSIGILSATEGSYSTAQFLLDTTQGSRVASSAYPTARPPALALRAIGASAVVEGWQAANERADDAPQLLRPGLLAAQIPGGAGYIGIRGASGVDGALAADRAGRVARVSLGGESTLLARVAALGRAKRLIVVDLPSGAEGYADLRALSRARGAGELLLVLERAPDAPGHELLWAGAAGLAGGGAKELSSQTTHERGLIAAIDLAPTILAHLGLTPIPLDMRGDPIHTDGRLRPSSLRSLMGRLRVIGARRLVALACLLFAWALLLLAAALWPAIRRTLAPSGRSGSRSPGDGSSRTCAWAMRTGALAVLWAPVAALIPAALEPTAAVEYTVITLTCLALGALTDRLLRWPRALLAPAVAAVVVLAADALAGTQLLMRSLLGPDPILGARFYGIGNELKSGLAVLVLAAVAAALYRGAPSERQAWAGGESRLRGGPRAALAIVGAGILLAAVEGSAKIGAGVGGVVLVSAGVAVAAVMLLPGRVTRRRAMIVLISPVAGLVVLAALDLATAHGSGHFTGSVLHARSAGDIRDLIVRRYHAAWEELHNHAMPAATALALVAVGLGLRRRQRLLAPVGGDPVWRAALAGGLAAGVIGALAEDSGPVLLVVAVFALCCVITYLWGRPPRLGFSSHSVGRPRGARSRARTRSGAPSR